MFDFLRGVWRRRFDDDREYYRFFYELLGFTPYNIELYKLALVHKSASVVLDNGVHVNNERLEYLGDAVIEAVTSDYLYIEFPQESEGFLTQMRSRIVSRTSLNGIAKSMGLHSWIVAGHNGAAMQKDVDGDTFEALMGAIYLDQGYDVVNRLLINSIYSTYLAMDQLLVSETDFKSRLIEWAQKEHHKIEFVTKLDSSSKANKPIFHSVVVIGGVNVGHGVGESKKQAEQRAAQSVSSGGVTDEASDELLSCVDRYEQTAPSLDVEERSGEVIDDKSVS